MGVVVRRGFVQLGLCKPGGLQYASPVAYIKVSQASIIALEQMQFKFPSERDKADAHIASEPHIMERNID
jgi:hypothetical protein